MGCIKNRAENPQIISREEARAAGIGRFYTGEPCKNGHVCERRTVNNACLDCILWSAQKAKQRDPERYRQYSLQNGRKFRSANPGSDHEYYLKNKERLLARMSRWQARNPGKVRNIKAASKKRNQHKANEYQRRRHATKKGAVPKWLTSAQLSEMRSIYQTARQMGADFEVDHIVPLVSKAVCGLHVPWNLQILTRAENTAKGNRLIAS